jgi:cobalt/nickel transport system permease protein
MTAGTDRGLMNFFGNASGLFARISPPARLLTGLVTGVCCVIIPGPSLTGLLSIAAILILFLTATGIPLVRLKRFVILAFIMYAPILLMALGITIRTPGHSAGTTWMVLAVKGAATLLVTGGTLSSLTLSEFGGSLRALQVPRSMSIIATHILQQTSVMISESVRTRQAILLRGDTSRFGTTFLLLRHLPATWLPRLLVRSQRVAAAMEVRGYEGIHMSDGIAAWRYTDLAALSAATFIVILSIAIRLSSTP